PPDRGPAPSPAPAPQPPRGSSSRRPLVTVAVAGAAAALTVTVAVTLPGHGDDKAGPPAGSPAASASPSAPASAPVSSAASSAGALPASWVGTWSGVGPGTPDADGITRARTGEFTVAVTLTAGNAGEIVGRQVSNVKEVSSGRDLGCTEALELRQIKGNTAVLAAATSHPTDRAASFDCPKGNLYVLTLEAPDRLTLASEGAQSAGAPAALTRSR
ncbi:hypothetical protein ACFXA3_22815, partial [Streptomyces sp. NPDC059456]